MPEDAEPFEGPRDPLVLNPAQIACWQSPLKREIFEALLALRQASIAELAAYMGRSSKSLYYHIRALCAVELVHLQATRPAGKRTEAVYAPVATRIILNEERTPSDDPEKTLRSHRALLRRIEQELRAAAEMRPEEGMAEVEVLRVITWLTPEARTQLEAMLEEIARFLRAQDTPQTGTRTALTLFMTCLKRK